MPTLANLTFDVADLIGADFDVRRTKVWIETNIASGSVIDTTGKVVRLGDVKATVGTDGKGSFTGLFATNSTDLNPTGFLYQVYVDYATRADGRKLWSSGWFPLTASSDLALVSPVVGGPVNSTDDAVIASRVNDPASQTRAAANKYYVGFDLRPTGDTTGVADRAALANLLTAAGSGLRAKQIIVTPGLYYFDAALVIPSGARIRCLGGGETGGAEWGAVFRFIGGAIPRFIDARNMIGGTFEGIVVQGGGTFAGTLLDLEGAQFVSFTDGNLTGQGAARPARLADLVNANQISFTRVNFTTAVDGVRGLSAATGQFSEIIRFTDCNFGTNGGGELSGVAIRNPNTDWVFSGCNFQPSTTGAPCAVAFDTLTFPAQGLTFVGCGWFDITTTYTGTAPWLDCRGLVNGITVIGGNATMGTSAPFVQVGGGGNQFGLVIKGLTANAVPGGTSATFVALGGGSFGGVDITGINYAGTWGSNPVTGVAGTGGGAIIAQPLGGFTTQGFGLLASKSYNPNPFAQTALTTVDADIDATNLAVTFIAPPSGTVLVEATILAVGDTSSNVVLTFRSGAATVTGTRGRAWNGPGQGRVRHAARVTGLTPGTSYTYKLGGYYEGTSGKVGYGDDGTTALGPAVFEVWAA